MITDEQLMADAFKWLTTPELQYNISGRPLGYVASVHQQWRKKNKISPTQRAYTIMILNKHWKK